MSNGYPVFSQGEHRQAATRSQTRPMARPRQSARVREARNAAYREVIIDAAERAFAEHGYEDARMQDIANDAGVSLATVYNIFDGKLELYRAIIDARGSDMVQATVAAIASLSGEELATPLSVILNSMGTYLTFFMEHPDFLRLHLRDGHIWFHASAKRSEQQEALWDQGQELIVENYNWGVRSGVLLDLDPEGQARVLIAVHQTRLANWVISGMETPRKNVIESVQAEFVRMFCTPDVVRKLLADNGLELRHDWRQRVQRISTV